MILKLNINDRAAIAIKEGRKKVEIRADKRNEKHNYEALKRGDIIEFCSDELGIFYVEVEEVVHYKNLEELFILEGTKYTTSSTDDKEQAIINVNKLDGYEQAIKKNGVYAIHIKYLYSKNTIWEELYEKARNAIYDRKISNMIDAGGVGAAILTDNHHIYIGVCIDIACSLGMCAERNAIANMITNGDKVITKLVCVDSRGEFVFPCGECREFLMQLDKRSKDIEILLDDTTYEIATMKELVPNWWGEDRFNNQ